MLRKQRAFVMMEFAQHAARPQRAGFEGPTAPGLVTADTKPLPIVYVANPS